MTLSLRHLLYVLVNHLPLYLCTVRKVNSPMPIAAGLISGAIVGKLIYDNRKESSENASLEAAFWGSMTAIGIGLFTFLTVQRYNGR